MVHDSSGGGMGLGFGGLRVLIVQSSMKFHCDIASELL